MGDAEEKGDATDPPNSETQADARRRTAVNTLLEIFLDTENDCLKPHDLPTASRSQLPPGADHNPAVPDRLQAIAAGVLKRLVAAHFSPPSTEVTQGKRQHLFGSRLLAPADGDQDGGPFQMQTECVAELVEKPGEGAPPKLDCGSALATSAGPSHGAAGKQASTGQPEKTEQSLPVSRGAREGRPDSNPPESGYRRMEAMRSLCSLSGDTTRRKACPLSVTVQSRPRLEKPRDDHLLASFVASAAEDSLRTLKPQIEELVDVFLLVFDNHKGPTPLRRKCLRTVAAFTADSAQAFTKHLGVAKLTGLVGRLLNIITEGFDTPWRHISQEDSLIARQALLHLVLSPKGAALVPVASEMICAMIRSADWRRRYRGLITLERLCHAEALAGSARGYECNRLLVDMCFDCVFRCLCDPDVRVRNLAIEVLDQTVACLSPAYVRSSQGRIIPDLLALLTPELQAEVINAATKTLTHYFSSCPQEVVVSYLGLLFYKLGALFTANAPCDGAFADYAALAKAVLNIVSTMAYLLQNCFRAFYHYFVPLMMELTASFGNTETRLRWVALDSVARVGLAVGKPQFIAVAPTIQAAVVTLLSDRWHWGNDPILGLAMSVALSTSRVLDDDCEDFMLQVLPLALQILARGDSGLARFHVKTCALLEWYALRAREGFACYVDEAVCCVLPLLSYPEPSVRASAAECLARLLACAPACGVTSATDRWVDANASLTSAIEKENDLSALLSQVCALEQLFGLIWLPLVPGQQIEAATAALDKCFEFYFRYNRPVEHFRSAPRPDRHELSARQRRQRDDAMRQALLQETADVVRTLVTHLKEDFLPFFDRLAPLVSKLLTGPRPWTEHLHGLSIIGDVLSLGTTACIAYSAYYLPEIVERLNSDVAPVKAAAARAVANLAELGGSAFAAYCVSAVPALSSAVAGARAHFPEESLCAELSMVALSRIMERHWNLLETQALADDLFPLFLSWLPVLRDCNLEPPLELLCSLLEEEEPVAMENAAHVVLVLVDALAHDHVAKESALGERVKACLRRQTRESVDDKAVWDALQDLLGTCSSGATGVGVAKPSRP